MGMYLLHIGNAAVTFNGPTPCPRSPYASTHVNVSWESASGIATLWANGKLVGRKGVWKGYSVGEEAKIILGQEQDSFGGHFDENQSFVGVIWDVFLWDHVLPPKEMCDSCYSGSLLNRHTLTYEDNGYVVTKPKVWA
uniref:Putative mucosal pentraxin homolog n=1 Tax=Homo sapiens TaxID=9606 RepID=MPTX_HUMAN|nr:PUTATIVE PSEUDOGENE: RecName: Full=Putative mucosal pentraxin homolog [Homo sapiens]